MTTLIYSGITGQALRNEYDKLGRKDRTVENTVSMAASRELSKENVIAYVNTSNTAIHAIKSFHNKSRLVSNKRLENKCKKCGRCHEIGKCPAKDKTCLICQRKGHFAKCFYYQPSSLSGANKTSTQLSNPNLRPVVKVYMVNEQGDYEGDAH